jgi:hypothetical protein
MTQSRDCNQVNLAHERYCALQSGIRYNLSNCGTVHWPPTQPSVAVAKTFSSVFVVSNSLRLRKVRLGR